MKINSTASTPPEFGLSLADRLVGGWQLVSYSTRTATGEVAHPLGVDAQGLIIYTPDGYMSAQIMIPNRPNYASHRVHGGTPAERDIAAGGYMAYSGPFRVDEAESVVWHHMQTSLYPNWVGDIQKRYVRLEGDVLTLSADPLVFRTTTLWPTLVWHRAATSPARHT